MDMDFSLLFLHMSWFVRELLTFTKKKLASVEKQIIQNSQMGKHKIWEIQ